LLLCPPTLVYPRASLTPEWSPLHLMEAGLPHRVLGQCRGSHRYGRSSAGSITCISTMSALIGTIGGTWVRSGRHTPDPGTSGRIRGPRRDLPRGLVGARRRRWPRKSARVLGHRDTSDGRWAALPYGRGDRSASGLEVWDRLRICGVCSSRIEFPARHRDQAVVDPGRHRAQPLAEEVSALGAGIVPLVSGSPSSGIDAANAIELQMSPSARGWARLSGSKNFTIRCQMLEISARDLLPLIQERMPPRQDVG